MNTITIMPYLKVLNSGVDALLVSGATELDVDSLHRAKHQLLGDRVDERQTNSLIQGH